MSDLTNKEVFDRLSTGGTNLYSQENLSALETAISNKKQTLPATLEQKVQGLQSLEKSVAARNSTFGQITGLGINSDLSRELIENSISGTGSLVKGTGDFASLVGFGEGEWSDAINDYLKEIAAKVDEQQTLDFRNKMIRSTPTGDLFDPSTWSAGSDVSLEGILGQVAAIGGQFTPQLLAMYLTRGASTPASLATSAAVGGAQAGGGAAENQENYIDNLSEVELLKNSQMYYDLRETRGHEEAKSMVKEAASRAALFYGGAVGVVGGAATNYILRPFARSLQGSKVGKATELVALSGLEEGAQEVSENVAAKAASNAAIGGNQDLTEGSFTDFTLGAGFGSGLGAGAFVASETGEVVDKSREAISKRVQAAQEAKNKVDEVTDAEEKASAFDDPEAFQTLVGKDPVRAATIAIDKKESDPEKSKQYLDYINQSTALDVDFYQQKLDEAKGKESPNKEQIKQFEEALKGAKAAQQKVLQLSKESARVQVEEAQTREEVVEKVTQKVEQSKDTAQLNTAVDEFIDLASTDADVISEEQVDRILLMEDVPEVKKQYLTAFQESRRNLSGLGKASGDVHNDILNGGQGFLGIRQYRDRFYSFLRGGNYEKAQETFSKLQEFKESRTNKKEVIKSLMEQSRANGGDQYLMGWNGNNYEFIPEGADTKKYENNINNIHAGSKKLLNYVTKEEAALDSVLKEFSSAFDVKESREKGEVTEPRSIKPETQSPQVRQQKVETKPTLGGTDTNKNGVKNPQSTETKDDETKEKESSNNEISKNDQSTVSNEEAKSEGTDRSRDEQEPDLVEDSEKLTRLKEQQEKTEARDKEYLKTDLLKAYFTKRKTGIPLTENNFLSNLIEEGEPLVRKYLPEGLDINPKQVEAINNFVRVARSWNKALTNSVGSFKENFKHTSPIQYLLNEEGDLPENVKTAISYAAYQYVAENAARGDSLTQSQVNDLFGRDKSTAIVGNERVFYTAGTHLDNVAQRLGNSVVQALGYKADKDAPANLVSRLEVSLGAQALALLMNPVNGEKPIMEQLNIPLNYFPDKAGKEFKGYGDKDVTVPFIRFNRWKGDDIVGLNNIANGISEANSGSSGILGTLFRTEVKKTLPDTSIPEKIHQTERSSRWKMSALQKKLIKEEQKKAFYLRPEMVDTFRQLRELDPNILSSIAGMTDLSTVAVHSVNQKSRQAKNEALERELVYLNEFLSEFDNNGKDYNQPFYFTRSVWAMFRVGLKSNTINPQTSKIHRHMLKMKAWDTEVSFDNSDQMNNFLLGVAEAFGIDVDKMPDSSAIEELRETLKRPGLMEGIRAMKKTLLGEVLTSEDAQAILGAFPAGKHSFHALEGMSAYAGMLVARDAKQSSFETSLMREVDGATNGPILTTLQLGGARGSEELTESLKKGGFFTESDSVKNFSLWKHDPNNSDLYETLSANIQRQLVNFIQADQFTSQIKAAQFFFGDLVDPDTGRVVKAGRNLAKTPLTGFMFGSSLDKAVTAMSEKMIDNYYEAIEEIAMDARQGKPYATKLKDATDAISAFLPGTLSFSSIEDAMAYEIPSNLVKEIHATFANTFGVAVKDAMSDQFDPIIQTRNVLNNAANTSFKIYKAVYDVVKKQYVSELAKAGEIPSFTKKGSNTPISLVDLSKEQEAIIEERIKDILPMVHTPLSQRSGDLSAGIFLGKESNNPQMSQLYAAHNRNKGALAQMEDTKNIKAKGRAKELVDPGVRNIIFMVHSLDSAISLLSAEKGGALNIHDAHGRGVGEVIEGAKALNENTYKLSVEYSIPMEISSALGRTIEGLINFRNANPELTTEIDKALSKIANSIKSRMEDDYPLLATMKTNGEIFNYFYSLVRHQALESTERKLETLVSITSVDQYALEGGQYDVTPEEKAKAQKQLDYVRSLKVGDPISKKEKRDPNVVAEAWGQLGEPNVAPDKELERILSSRKDMDSRSLVRVLEGRLRGTQRGRMQKLNLLILKKITPLLPKDLKVFYATSQSSPKMAPAGITTARGGYDPKTNTIYLKSPDFVHSGLTPELLLHELVHAALSRSISKPNKSGKRFIKELKAIREAAKGYVEANKLTQYKNAVQNIDELLAWGLSNPGFQRDVLNKIEYRSTNGADKFVRAMKGFISAIVNVLFSGSTKTREQQMNNGMTALIINASGLIATTNTKRKKKKAPAEETDANGVQQQEPSKTDSVKFMQDSTPNSPMSFTTEQVFEELVLHGSALEPGFKNHLKSVINAVVTRIHGPYGAYKLQAENSPTSDIHDVYLKSLVTGKLPFASESVSKLGLDEATAFVVQQVEMTLQTAFDMKQINYNELNRLYNETKKKIDPSSLPDGAYEFIFGQATNPRYLSQFAALGLAYPPLFAQMEQITADRTDRTGSQFKLGAWLKDLFNKVLSLLSKQVPRVYAGQRGSDQLRILVDNLVDLETRKKSELVARRAYTPSRLEQGMKTISNSLRSGVEKAATSSFAKRLPTDTLKAAAAVTGAVAGDRGDKLVDAIVDLRNKNNTGREGFIASLVTEMKGIGNDVFFKLLNAANKHQQERQFIIDETANIVLDGFEDNGKELNKEQLSALTRVLLRSDVASLLSEKDMEGTLEALVNPKYRSDLIEQITQTVMKTGHKDRHYFLRQAKDLGYFLARGVVKNENLQMNATNIVRLAGTSQVNRTTGNEIDSLIKNVDMLASLYSLSFMPSKEMDLATTLIRSEMQRDGENGVASVLRMQYRLQKEALESSFGDNPFSFMKGYTKDITNPHRSVILVDAQDMGDYLKKGWKATEPLPRDVDDPVQGHQVIMYADKGLQEHTTGVVSYSGKRARGTRLHNGLFSSTGDTFYTGLDKDTQQLTARRKAKVDKLFKPNPSYDPTKASDINKAFLVPVIGAQGQVVNYRYLMREEVKDKLLQRDNQVHKVLGAMAGATFDKAGTEELNGSTVQALFDQYREEYQTNPQAYIEFSPNSDDPKIRETYALLPDSTKKAIKRIWGEVGMQVRADQYNLIFGYRKYSLADIWDKEPEHRSIMENIIKGIAEFIVKDKAQIKTKRLEDIWQEMVLATKDIIVIKNLFTLLGNISSNVTLLMLYGVPPTTIWKTHVTALKGVTAHFGQKRELFKVDHLLDSGGVTGAERKELLARKAELEDAMSRNPIKELVDAGMFQTIVSDVDASDDTFSYQSRMSNYLSEKTTWIPDVVKEGGKTLIMTHDTPLYKVLNQATSVSDFVARYALHQHLTNKQDSPMSKDESLKAISEAFVNYDIPSGQGLQYLNDMGIVWFTKYFLRIQKVLIHLFRENPARALAVAMFAHFFPQVPTITESGFYNRLGNPIGEGAFALADAVDEPILIKAGTSVF